MVTLLPKIVCVVWVLQQYVVPFIFLGYIIISLFFSIFKDLFSRFDLKVLNGIGGSLSLFYQKEFNLSFFFDNS